MGVCATSTVYAGTILSFPGSEDRFGFFASSPADSTNFTVPSGQTVVVFDAIFGPTIARNPNIGYVGSDPSSWNTPAFFGGYRLLTTNSSNDTYNPNFVRGVVSPAVGPGYASLPVTQIAAFGNSGTITNTVTGAFVTPTPISGLGVFHLDLLGTPFLGATGNFRGVVFDGTNWLVTADEGLALSGATGIDIFTAGGWQVLNTSDYSISPNVVSLQGSITYSGLYFQATEISSVSNAGFDLRFSNVTFNAVPESLPTGIALLTALALLLSFYRNRKSQEG
jgi:hypothetical protein